MFGKINLLKLAVVLGLGWTASAYSADIIPARGVSLLMVNGAEAKGRMEPSPLKPGLNQIVVRMDKSIGKGSSNGVFTSVPFVITFEAGEQDVEVNHPKVHTIQHAEQVFKNNPEWHLTSDGETVEFVSEEVKGKKGFMPHYDLNELVRAYNQEHGIYLGPEAVEVAAATQVSASEMQSKGKLNKSKKQPSVQATAHPKALEQLQAWYLKASQEDRKAFRKWVVDQD